MNQIKAVVWGAALVLLALIGGTGWLLYERIESTVAPKDAATKKDIERVEVKQKQQDQRLGDLESRVTVAEGRITDVEKETGKLRGELNTLQTELKQVKEKGEANSASIKDLETKIAEKEKRIADLEKERDKTRQDMQAMQKDIEEIKRALGIKRPD